MRPQRETQKSGVKRLDIAPRFLYTNTIKSSDRRDNLMKGIIPLLDALMKAKFLVVSIKRKGLGIQHFVEDAYGEYTYCKISISARVWLNTKSYKAINENTCPNCLKLYILYHGK